MDDATRTTGPLLSLALLLARVPLGGILVFAAYNKIPDPQGFAFAIEAYKILPDHLVHLSAFLIPWLEAIAGVLLILGLAGRAAAICAAVLMASFIVAILSVMARESVVVSECSCFGKANLICKGPPSWCHIVQNTVLLALAVLTVLKGPGMFSLDRLLARRPHEPPTLIDDEPTPDARPI